MTSQMMPVPGALLCPWQAHTRWGTLLMAHREKVVDKAWEVVEDAVYPYNLGKLQDLVRGRGVDGGQEVAAEGVGVHLHAYIMRALNQTVARRTCSSGVVAMRAVVYGRELQLQLQACMMARPTHGQGSGEGYCHWCLEITRTTHAVSCMCGGVNVVQGSTALYGSLDASKLQHGMHLQQTDGT